MEETKMKTGNKLLLIGGIIVAVWISILILTQITRMPMPFFTATSGGTSLQDGMIVETFQVVPEVTMFPIVGFTLLVLGTLYLSWNRIASRKKPILIIFAITLGIFFVSLASAYILQEKKLDALKYDVNYIQPDKKFAFASVPHTVEITGLKPTYKKGEEITFTILLKGNGTFCKGYDLQFYNVTRGLLWGNKGEENVCSSQPLDFERAFQYSSFPRTNYVYSDKLIIDDIPPIHIYPSDYDIVFVTGYGDVIKKRVHITDLSHGVSNLEERNAHYGPENTSISVTGNDAKDICSALKIPCPSEPIFSHATQIGNGEISLSFSANDELFDVKLNQTHVCLISDKTHSTKCDVR